MSLIVNWCSYDAAKFAVERWHYSHRMPAGKMAKLGIWEDGEYIGCVLFGSGATRTLGNPYKLKPTECCELTRVALREHHTHVSRIIRICLIIIRKQYTRLRLVVSYADQGRNHHGGIYQAGGWIYTGETQKTAVFIHNKTGEVLHHRSVWVNENRCGKKYHASECEKIIPEAKHRYLMPLDGDMRKTLEVLRQPYPKRPKQAMAGTTGTAAG